MKIQKEKRNIWGWGREVMPGSFSKFDENDKHTDPKSAMDLNRRNKVNHTKAHHNEVSQSQ